MAAEQVLGQSDWMAWGIVAVAAAALIVVASPSEAVSIVDPNGPLIGIHISSVHALDCQVQVDGIVYVAPGAESDGEFWGFTNGVPNGFPNGIPGCGTFLRYGGTLYGPNAGGFTFAAPAPTQFTTVSQTPVTGTGTAANPYSVVTTVNAGSSAQLVQTDTYVVGAGFYLTSITVTNTSPVTQNFMLYRGGDCYLETNAQQDAGDSSYGWMDLATHSFACTFTPNVLGNHFIAWIPVSQTTGTVNGQESSWNSPWSRASSGLPYLDTCQCNVPLDSGGGLSWTFSLLGGTSGTFVSRNAFTVSPPQPAFTFIVPTECDDSTVFFQDLSTDPDDAVVSWDWDFGDLSTAVGANPSHEYAASGTYQVTLTVTDASGLTASLTLPVTYVAANCCPVLEPLPDLRIREGQTFRFVASSFDQDGDPLTFTLADPHPVAATLGANSGAFFWTTRRGDAGTYPITVSVTDGECGDVVDLRLVVDHVPNPTLAPDADIDGIEDAADNCPSLANRDQGDLDHDGTGDACDDSPCPGCDPAPPAPGQEPDAATDADLDGIDDRADNCPVSANRSQLDQDGDGDGDACDDDLDGDGLAQWAPAGIARDNCPLKGNPDQLDSNGDGVGDACAGLDDAVGSDSARGLRDRPVGEAATAPGFPVLPLALAGVAFLGTLGLAVGAAVRRRSR